SYLALTVGLDDATRHQHVSVGCNGTVKDVVQLAELIATKPRSGRVLPLHPQPWPRQMRRKASHWLERRGQAGEPRTGEHRQLGGKSRCVSDRHVVEIRGAADFCNGVASGCRVSSDRWSALLLTADLSRLAARVRNVPILL